MERVRLESLAARGWPSPAVAIGNFDGVHRGHEALAAAVAAWARENGGTSVVLTLDPHPARVLAPSHAPPTLTTLEQKAELLAALGVQRLAILPFTAELQRRSAQEFARMVLAGSLGARRVAVGEDFRFGHDREGGTGTLRDLGRPLGFGVDVVPPVLHEGRPVSSSWVREALGRGRVEEARALLGRDYFVDGVVVEGERRGRTLGFPTANLETENEILPAPGVFAARCRLPSGEWADAVVNIGRRPTFGGREVSVEAHVLGFAGEVYGQSLRVAFHARLREERRFPGPEALVAQIREDVERARAILAGIGGEGV